MRTPRILVSALLAAILWSCASLHAPLGANANATPQASSASQPAAASATLHQISGEIASWSDRAFTLKVGAVAWKFTYDRKACAILGKPIVGAKAQVRYVKDGDNKIARQVKISKGAD